MIDMELEGRSQDSASSIHIKTSLHKQPDMIMVIYFLDGASK